MYKYNVSIKSGTGGWFDYDGCDCNIKTLEANFLPRIGETLSIRDETGYKDYLVRDVKYWYIDEKYNGITVYVIPV